MLKFSVKLIVQKIRTLKKGVWFSRRILTQILNKETSITHAHI